jgi:hypothetical protein
VVRQEASVLSNWREAARTTRQETAAHLTIAGGDTNKEPEFDFNPLMQQTIKAVAEPKIFFLFRANAPTNQPALPAFTQKELFVFEAGYSAC